MVNYFHEHGVITDPRTSRLSYNNQTISGVIQFHFDTSKQEDPEIFSSKITTAEYQKLFGIFENVYLANTKSLSTIESILSTDSNWKDVYLSLIHICFLIDNVVNLVNDFKQSIVNNIIIPDQLMKYIPTNLTPRFIVLKGLLAKNILTKEIVCSQYLQQDVNEVCGIVVKDNPIINIHNSKNNLFYLGTEMCIRDSFYSLSLFVITQFQKLYAQHWKDILLFFQKKW